MSEHLDDEQLCGLPLLDEDDPARVAAADHLASCERCRAELARAKALLSLLDAAPEPPPPRKEVLSRARDAVIAAHRGEQSLDLASAAVTAIAGTLVIALGARAVEPSRFVVSLLAIGAATAIAALASLRARHAHLLVGAVVASLAIAGFDLVDLTPRIDQHAGCERVIWLAALAPAALALWVSRRPSASGAGGAGTRVATAAASGALAGQGALLTWCTSHEHWAHVLVFHVLALIASAAIGGAVGRATQPDQQHLNPVE